MFGAANGLITIARGAVPLALFGADGYGRLIGRIAGPWLVMQAAAPLVIAFVAERASDPAALALAAASRVSRWPALPRSAGRRCTESRMTDGADSGRHGYANIASMSSCEEWPRVAGELRAVQELAVPFSRRVERDRLEVLDAAARSPSCGRRAPRGTPDCHHLGDALAGEVLEIAGFENLHHAVLDVVASPCSCSLLSAADSVLAA